MFKENLPLAKKNIMSEPYTNDFTYWHDREVKFESQYTPSGIRVIVYEKMTNDEKIKFIAHLKKERDIVSISFK